MLDVNQQHTEFGIAPDVAVSLREEDELRGYDTLIETARELIRK